MPVHEMPSQIHRILWEGGKEFGAVDSQLPLLQLVAGDDGGQQYLMRIGLEGLFHPERGLL